MKITAIKAQVKNPERVSVYIDEKYSFSLNHAQLLDVRIHVGLEIDEVRLNELKKISDFGKAYERGLNYAMIRPHSIKELRDYAWRKKWAPEDAEVIIAKLVAKGYVNDAAFARSWVESRALLGKSSQRKLKLELKQKGIADDVIQAALAAAEYDERSALRQLVEKKRRLTRYKGDDQKLTQYLARQGFSFDDISAVLKDTE